MIVSWDATANERDSAVTAYRVNLKSKNGISYQVATCLGSEPQVVIDRSCSIPTTVLTAHPFLLEEGDTVVAIVEALNEIDYSEPSEENQSGAVIQVVPHAPLTIPTRGGQTGTSQIEVHFDEITEDGGSPILSYALEIDRADGAGFTVAVGDPVDSLDTTILITDSISSGQFYPLRYRARNVHGWSEYSQPDAQILASSVPSEPLNIVTSNVPLSTTVTITWDAPLDSGGDGILIDTYYIFIFDKDGVDSYETGDCDGTDQTIIDARTCEVEMATLISAPYSLAQGADVIVQVQAGNSIGTSALSLLNTDYANIALVEVVPQKPPGSPRRDQALSSDSLLQVEFDALSSPEHGGAEILSYHLQYDDASGGAIWTDLLGYPVDELDLSFGVVDSIDVGETYLFRYRARNVHGWGEFSDNLEFIAASIPDVPTTVVTSNEGTDIKIVWDDASYNGGSPLLYFRVLLKKQDDTFAEDTIHCNGADQTTKANLFCLIPVEALIVDPILLQQGDLVVATVEAYNIIGFSAPSLENTEGASIRSIPQKPVGLVERVESGTTDTQITVQYANFDTNPENGGSPLFSLNLYWDQGASNWVSVAGETPNYTMALT